MHKTVNRTAALNSKYVTGFRQLLSIPAAHKAFKVVAGQEVNQEITNFGKPLCRSKLAGQQQPVLRGFLMVESNIT